MSFYLTMPIALFKFWYVEAPSEMLGFFASLNNSFFQLFSLPLLLQTFFQPIKNEYRKGLVGFSIGMGIAIKSVFILADIIMLLLLIIFEIATLGVFILFPFGVVLMLFI